MSRRSSLVARAPAPFAIYSFTGITIDGNVSSFSSYRKTRRLGRGASSSSNCTHPRNTLPLSLSLWIWLNSFVSLPSRCLFPYTYIFLCISFSSRLARILFLSLRNSSQSFELYANKIQSIYPINIDMDSQVVSASFELRSPESKLKNTFF